MNDENKTINAALLSKGVKMPQPDTVYVAPDVNPDRISPQTTLQPGCRLSGADLSIGPDTELGREGPVTLINCQLGARVQLAGGFFENAVFLDDVAIGADAHVRPGTLLEEQVTCGHAVGLKQTLMLSYVTTGSLINFCDCAMTGGTSRKNHSEVGSSYVHFNFSPSQDKATASFMGDVPHGVMLDQAPIFLGGQGGLVGPARVAFGTVVAAGSILRGDVLEPNRLIATAPPVVDRPFEPGACPNIARKSLNNQRYIANLCALRAWYHHVRAPFFARSPSGLACGEGAQHALRLMCRERIQRAQRWADALPDSPKTQNAAERQNALQTWQAMPALADHDNVVDIAADARQAFTQAAGDPDAAETILDFIHQLTPEARTLGTAWLQTIVDTIATPASD
ncbi:MAG: hypothetical protein ACI9OU_000700 [Candidatus Promineifilaceae bacterium]|jgi:hypothetical protein